MDITTDWISHTHNVGEIDLKELFKTILHYKWSIFVISFVILLMTAFFLYFGTPLYMSSAVIEVKTDKKESMVGGDFLGSDFSNFGDQKVDKEIEILTNISYQ